MGTRILQLDNISMVYHSLNGETEALENIDFSVERGEFIGIVGPSGCGKSTVLSIIAGLLKPTCGNVTLLDEPVSGPNEKVAYMLQRDHLFDWRTIGKNAVLGLEVRKKLTPESKAKTLELLHTYGLGEFIDRYPQQLSGGMRQKAALIRTLAVNPEILLLDEPFSALDFQTRLAVEDEIYDIIKKEQKTAIMVTHDISEAISMSDRVIVFSKRPSSIKSIHPIKLETQGGPIKKRNDAGFKEYFDRIWKELDIHVM